MASETQSSDFSLNEPLPADFELDIDHLVTEDDTPVDNIYSEKQQRLLTEPLHSSWQPGAKFVALANVGLFYKLHDAEPFVPDMMLSLDVTLPENIWKKQNRSYFVWEYGKPPEVVVEVVSNRKGGEDDKKLKGYAQIGVKYYVIHDPEKHLSNSVLRGYKLDGSEYRAIDEPFYFGGVGLGLKLWEGTYEDRDDTWLRWYDAHGDLILTGKERADAAEQRVESTVRRLESALQRAEAVQQQAELALKRAESTQQRAESAERLAAKLAAQLRHLGIEPEA